MTSFWALAVDRDDLSRTMLFEDAVPEIGDGEALLRVDRVGLTANNVTYAVLGKSFRYWDFFPTAGGFRDASQHRAQLPSPYNAYALTTGDKAYRCDQEDLLILYRPLFFTSFMLADRLEDNGLFGAEVVALSSASSKTAYGTAALLRGKAPQVVGLTSAGNVAFVESLGCYDRVLPYEAVDQLSPAVPTAYLDFAGRAELRGRIRRHLDARLVYEAVVGITSQEQSGAQALSGPRTSVFFAPDQMRKRAADWGREELDLRFAEAWRSFAAAAEAWVDVVSHQGPEALRQVWLEVLAGRSAPRVGHVLTF